MPWASIHGGRLHQGERQDLHDVVLDDVAQRPGGLVEAAAVLDAELLGHGDLDVVDVAAVPDRLEDGVGEAQGQDVLDRLLAQVVVDAEDLVLVEGAVQRRRRGPAALARSRPKGFSTTSRAKAPSVAGLVAAVLGQRARPRAETSRDGGQVVERGCRRCRGLASASARTSFSWSKVWVRGVLAGHVAEPLHELASIRAPASGRAVERPPGGTRRRSTRCGPRRPR